MEQLPLRPSTRYDVFINDKPYPPKEVMAYAHQIMNGEKSWKVSGGGPTNKYLRGFGFLVKKKSTPKTDVSTNYWWVNQGYSFDYEYEKKILRAPDDEIHHHKFLKNLKVGDFVLHYSRGAIVQLSNVIETFHIEPYAKEEDRQGNALVVRVEFIGIQFPIEIDKIRELLHGEPKVLPEKYSPITSSWGVNQGYLFPFTKKGYDILFGTEEEEDDNTLERYFVVGASWKNEDGTRTDKSTEFLNNGIWENGYDEEFIEETNSVPVGAHIAIKATRTLQKTKSVMTIQARGVVIGNRKDGHFLDVEWEKNLEPFIVDFSGGYWATIHEVTKLEHIAAIFGAKLDQFKTMQNTSLNTILYGPPGTGKTFNSINHAIAIIDNKEIDVVSNQERSAVKSQFDNYLKEGRIVFTTFHQSLSYEDFIEGIKPETVEEEVTYEVKDGIFKKLCLEAAFTIARERRSAETTKALDFANLYDQFVDSVEVTLSTPGTSVEVPTKSGGKIQIAGISPQGNILVKHIDGSRTYTISKQRLTVLDQNIEDLDEISNVNTTFREIIGGSNSSAYFAILKVIRSLQPKTEVSDRVYSMDDKIAAVRALTPDDYKKASGIPFVIIMDEINRGNISQIFGELITLIEDDKRLGRDEALEVTLPYSKEKFGVPPNIHLIGTMNTADRSVEALDTALRRRFSFKEIPPDSKLITAKGKLKSSQGKVEGIDLTSLLDVINNRIEKLSDKDHLIGHSYFMNIEKLSDLKQAFQNKINPLLQEYFYGDFGKIGLVIGKAFFTEESLKANDDDDFFAEFPEYETSELLERRSYHLKNIAEMNDQDFINALNKLFRK